MGDEAEYGSFQTFQEHIKQTKLEADATSLTYRSGSDTLTASWDAFTVNAKDSVAGLREPGGVKIVADGGRSMGRWAVKESREIDIRYTPFGGVYRATAEKELPLASLIFVSGTKGKPKVTLNDKDVTADLKAWTHDGVEGWLVPLAGNRPADDQIAPRLTAAQALVGRK